MYEPGLTAQPLWSLEDLGDAGGHLANLEKHWKLLRDEALQLVKEHNWTIKEKGVWTRGEKTLEQMGRWQQLVFFGLGYPELPEEVCSSAPTMCSLTGETYNALACPFGQIKLSVLQGATHVAPHCGLTNTRLRAHLPLVVPTDIPPRIRVAEQMKEWKEGKVIVFDDSFEHEVWNESNETRIVLIVDINHPELTEERRNWYQTRLKVMGQDVDGPRYDLVEEDLHEELVNKQEL